MATAISTQPPSATPKMKPPRPPSLSAGTPTTTIASPPLGSKRPPTFPAQPSSAAPAASNNGMVSRSTARQRRESGRALKTNNQNGNGAPDGPRGTKRKFREPFVRTTSHILKKHAGAKPSLILHLHPTHWRFDQQDGSFGYNSPIKDFLEHLKAQTVPHDMLEELLNSQVVFYDGCLIVEVHDHKTGGASMRNKSSGAIGGDEDEPYSIHNYNQHLTPSPYVAYPAQAHNAQVQGERPKSQSNGTASVKPEDVKESPVQVEKKTDRIFTTVMHPTEQSRYREQCILATTPVSERNSRKAPGRDAPTPLSATNTHFNLLNMMPNGKPAKRPKMYLEEKDFHDFEAAYLVATEPPLLLEPARSLDEALDIMKKLEHPLHTHAPAPSKGRKRTATELAADEAQAAEEEKMGLIFDERLQPSLGARGGDEGADAANTARDFEPNFSRFKKLEEIRTRHEEEKKQRAEAEAQAQIAKRQHQEQETQRRQREEVENRQKDLQRQMLMRQMAQRNGGQMNGQAHMVQQQMMQAQAAGSPIMRNQTPTNASSPLAMNGNGMQQSMSNNNHGSPPRPGSANMRQMPAPQMARQVSQQQSQHGTPHQQNATPHMGHNVPGRMTPQPGMSAGSPPQMQGTPMMGQGMMGTSQLNGQPQQLTAQQRALVQQQMAVRNQAQQRMQAQAQHMSSSPNPNQFGHQMTPQQMQQMLANQQQQQLQANGQQMQGMGGNPQMAQQMGANRQSQYAQQMQARMRAMQMQAQQGQQANGMPNFQQAAAGMFNSAQMQASLSQQPNGQQNQFMQGAQNMGGNQASPNAQHFQQQNMTPAQQQAANQARQREQALKNQFMQHLMQTHGGMLPQNANELFAQQKVQMMQRAAMRRAQQQGAGQPGMMGQGGQGAGRGVDPTYVVQLEQQRQHMQRQQIMRQQQQQQAQARMMNGMPPGQ